MSTAKRRKIHNSYRYFTIAADEYGERCMKGSIFHAGRAPGIRSGSFLGTDYPEPPTI